MAANESFAGFDCDQVYCIDRANGFCNKGWHCCTCVCRRAGYPYADQALMRCVPHRPTTTATSTSTSTQLRISTTTTRSTAISTTARATSSRPSSTSSTPAKTTDPKTLYTKFVNTTAIPVLSTKSSVPVAAIVGSVLGTLLLVACIVLVWLLLTRRHSSTKKRESNVATENAMPPLPREDIPLNDIGIRESENPYYKDVVDEGTSNHYYDPGEVLESRKISEGADVYYSSADVVANAKERAKNFEYSYARGGAMETKLLDQGNQYQGLDSAQYQPGLYQQLGADKVHSAGGEVKEARNPYYDTKPELDAVEEKKSRGKKPISLRNNAGSREDVSQVKGSTVPGDDKEHYLGLTVPAKQNIYEPLHQDEYLDMSIGSKSDGEYMYAAP